MKIKAKIIICSAKENNKYPAQNQILKEMREEQEDGTHFPKITPPQFGPIQMQVQFNYDKIIYYI